MDVLVTVAVVGMPRTQTSKVGGKEKTGKTLLPSHFSPFHGPLHFIQKRFLRRGSTPGEVQPLTLLYTIFKREGTPLTELFRWLYRSIRGLLTFFRNG